MKNVKALYKKAISVFVRNSNRNSKTLFFTKDILKEKNFFIGDYTYGVPIVLFNNQETKLLIGSYTSIAKNVTIMLGGNHRADWISTYPFSALNDYFPESSHIKGHPATKGDVEIGNDVWVGQDSIILSGVSIADGAIIGARSVVTKDVGPYEIWAGNPARLIRKRFNEEEILKLMEFQWWKNDIKMIKELIPILCSSDVNDLIKK